MIGAALVGVLGLAVTAATVQAAPRAVIFGTMERDSTGSWQLARETTKISRRAVSGGSSGSFGIVIEGGGAESFTYQIILIDPGAHRTIGSVQTVTPRYTGAWRLRSIASMEAGDPLGDWKLEVHVNGTLWWTIPFVLVD